jgi:acetylornithine deacetylase
MEHLYQKAIDLLQQLISIPSFSKEEQGTAALLQDWLSREGIISERIGNNLIARSKHFDTAKPTVLLNSHHDTVKPAVGYTLYPFSATVKEDKLYGLGSNDAGGSLASLMATFLHFHDRQDLPFNLVLAAVAEEEISGAYGLRSILPRLGHIDCAIVGEPTSMSMAVAERGLLVLDVTASGLSGHAARNEGINAIHTAMKDISWIDTFAFERESPLLGKVSMNVTAIETINKAHNVIPDQCGFTVDIRINELYAHEEILHTITENLTSAVKPRSTHLKSSNIAMDHPLVKSGLAMGLSHFGSPTLSDKALMPFPALKIGPGDYERSHTDYEFIYLEQNTDGI